MERIEAEYRGNAKTVKEFPLVTLSDHGLPALLNFPNMGVHVEGEVYAVSVEALKALDRLEGTSRGLYTRSRILVHSGYPENTFNPYVYFFTGYPNSILYRLIYKRNHLISY